MKTSLCGNPSTRTKFTCWLYWAADTDPWFVVVPAETIGLPMLVGQSTQTIHFLPNGTGLVIYRMTTWSKKATTLTSRTRSMETNHHGLNYCSLVQLSSVEMFSNPEKPIEISSKLVVNKNKLIIQLQLVYPIISKVLSHDFLAFHIHLFRS